MVDVSRGTYDAASLRTTINGKGDAMQRAVKLTARESDVLWLLARGCTYSQAALALGVSRHTIATHIKSAYAKLDVHSAAAAVMRAIELRLIAIAGASTRKLSRPSSARRKQKSPAR
jgi:DNA-binding CsgD family transcriptional regulator